MTTTHRGGEEMDLDLYKSEDGRQKIMDWYDAVEARIEAPVESVRVATRYGETHMLASGHPDAEPLLLLPGVAGAAPLYRHALDHLHPYFRVYAVDIVGQPGRSAPNPPSLLDSSYVDWLRDVLEGLGLESAHIAGQSAGGAIAMQVGIEAPELARSVIMFGPTGLARSRLPIKIWFTKVLSNRSSNALEDDLTAKSIRPKRTGESFGTYDRDLARLMALCTRHFRVDRSLRIYNPETGRLSIRKGLRILKKFFMAEPREWQSRLRVPALLVFGEHELFFDPSKIAEQVKKNIPHIETAVVPHAGHGAIYDQPAKVCELVRGFVFERIPGEKSCPTDSPVGQMAS